MRRAVRPDQPTPDPTTPALLVLDGTYTLETLRKLGDERLVTCRDLGGFFALAQLGLFLSLLALIRRERIAIVRIGDPLYLGLFGWALAALGGAKLAIRVNGNTIKSAPAPAACFTPSCFAAAALKNASNGWCFPAPISSLRPTRTTSTTSSERAPIRRARRSSAMAT